MICQHHTVHTAHTGLFHDLLDNFGLTERVQQPTHKHRHQLDVFITRDEQLVSALRVDPPMLLSDHSLVAATLVTSHHTAPALPVVHASSVVAGDASM